MKRFLLLPVLALLANLCLTGCVVYSDDYYDTQPAYAYHFSDDFNNDQNGWSFSDPAHAAYASISDGRLHYDYHPGREGNHTLAVATGMPVSQAVFDLQTRFRSDYTMALVWGVSQDEYGYSFSIDSRGYFAVFDGGNARIAAQPLLDWKSSGAIREGWNDLELQAQADGTWTGYINHVQVFQISARRLYGSQVGFQVEAGTSGDAEFIDLAW